MTEEKTKMHIFVITDVFYPVVQGDVVRVYKDALALQELGHKVTLISPHKGVQGINCRQIIKPKLSQFLLALPFEILKIHRHEKIDIIWFHRYYLTLLLLIISKILKVKLIAQIHGPERKELAALSSSSKKIFHKILYLLSEPALKQVSKIVVVEEKLAKWLIKDLKISREKIIFIGNYPDLSLFKPAKRIPVKFTVGYLGSLGKDRVQPLMSLSRNDKIMKVMVIGAGEDEKIITGNKHIKYLVERDYQRVPYWINKFSVGIIFPLNLKVNFAEKGPPMKFFEYLACGLPVIGINIPRLKTLIRDNKIGILTDEEHFEEGIKEIRKNYEQYRENVLRFRIKLERNYSWSQEKNKIAKLLSQMY